MHIVCPITKLEHVKHLIECGADEFYTGILMNWNDRYNIINSINRRYSKNSNFSKLRDLEKAINIMNQHNIPIFVTMNAPYYVPEQYTFLKNYIKILVNMGVAGFLVSEIKLIDYIRKNYPKTEIHLSTVSTCSNLESFNFFKKRGVTRTVLPRELTIDEIRDIKKEIDIETEVFYSPLDCSNIDGYCSFQHIGTSKCFSKKYSNTFFSESGLETLGCANIQNCKLCQIYDLFKANVTAIKIIGRGDFLSRIENPVSCLFKMINFLRNNKGISKKEFFDFVQKEILARTFFRCDPDKCLYV